MTTTEPATAARAVAVEAARTYQEAFGERLLAAYLLGSLSYGGYSPAVSDIDLAVVLADRHDDDPATFEALGESLRERGPLHRKLSVFWGSLPALSRGEQDGRFPAIDRLELAEHATLLFGEEVTAKVARPDSEQLRVESARFAVAVLATDEVLGEFARPKRLLADPVWFTKAVFFPLRFGYTGTTATGRAATNDEAITWYLGRPDASAAPLVHLARQVREGRPLNPAEAEPQLLAHLRPLYRQYVEEETARLREAGAPEDLVAAFTSWHEQLSS
ncbi:nucleotidyltransferase domain-containing protein [Amycolatopsis sp. WQ 127309]|uniref:nucleotidyltransferase domain-containing protein n=1 Tax=Amycolatopsis sp. WQ 127309 TaxID=2932773 RepID=UPI001FF63C3D|nr:nucleotidyltransferase domain-containing protein [Amycolatopsis sp. WQ 127309]UOZ06339.1 nucleotidyltransferase domain-containing protein [Amycolatopsis sp. WQ 127309]